MMQSRIELFQIQNFAFCYPNSLSVCQDRLFGCFNVFSTYLDCLVGFLTSRMVFVGNFNFLTFIIQIRCRIFFNFLLITSCNNLGITRDGSTHLNFLSLLRSPQLQFPLKNFESKLRQIRLKIINRTPFGQTLVSSAKIKLLGSPRISANAPFSKIVFPLRAREEKRLRVIGIFTNVFFYFRRFSYIFANIKDSAPRTFHFLNRKKPKKKVRDGENAKAKH